MDPLTFKIDQVALYTSHPSRSRALLSALFGLEEWVSDVVTADGYVFGRKVSNVKGELWFNYQTGVELELLHYPDNRNWHGQRGKLPGDMFLSHLGTHVANMNLARLPFELKGWRVAQEFWTTSHTNPYLLERGRTYHYVVFDSRDKIGFDLKLIQRRENIR